CARSGRVSGRSCALLPGTTVEQLAPRSPGDATGQEVDDRDEDEAEEQVAVATRGRADVVPDDRHEGGTEDRTPQPPPATDDDGEQGHGRDLEGEVLRGDEAVLRRPHRPCGTGDGASDRVDGELEPEGVVAEGGHPLLVVPQAPQAAPEGRAGGPPDDGEADEEDEEQPPVPDPGDGHRLPSGDEGDRRDAVEAVRASRDIHPTPGEAARAVRD